MCVWPVVVHLGFFLHVISGELVLVMEMGTNTSTRWRVVGDQAYSVNNFSMIVMEKQIER
jgi:hypothetical protein